MLAILLAVPIFGKTIYQSGTGTAESKTEACRIALENAQKEALYQSGINIVSIYEKTQVSDSEIKKKRLSITICNQVMDLFKHFQKMKNLNSIIKLVISLVKFMENLKLIHQN